MEQPGLHQRHRDENGEISRKHGNTLISTLRKSGNSIVVSIPREELERVGVKVGEQVSVEIRPVEVRPRLAADLQDAAEIELERSHEALDYLAR